MICVYDKDQVRVGEEAHRLHSPIEAELLAQQIAWGAVFQQLDFQVGEPGKFGRLFEQALRRAHVTAELLLSEVADFGCQVTQNARKNSGWSFLSGLDFKGQLQGLPALIIGAGPSLKTSLEFLHTDKALLFAAGSAAEKLPMRPHFVGAVDKDKPLISHPDSILCTQLRAHPAAWQSHSKRLVFPDSHLPWLNWILGEEKAFESGWTVANFLTAVAVWAGCDPIVFVGMDFCGAEGPIETQNSEGKTVRTQRDWLLAAAWTDAFLAKHPETRFINATPGSLRAQEGELEEVLSGLPPLGSWPPFASMPLQAIRGARWEEWRQTALQETLLDPLWALWRPVFEREGGDLELHKRVFFDGVVREHFDGT